MKSNRLFKTAVVLGVALLIAAPIILADTPATSTASHEKAIGKIEGVVKDARTGEIIQDAYVYVEGCTQAAMTNNAGKFYLNQVPCGNGVLKATRKGYKPIELQVEVESKKTANYIVNMKQAPKQVVVEEES